MTTYRELKIKETGGLVSVGDPRVATKAEASELSSHTSASTSVHGIANTADLATKAYADSAAASVDELRQYGAEGSVIRNLATRVHPAEQLLKQSVLWLDAAHESAGGQEITNLGWGGSVLNARSGSTTGADSNDPKFLDWDGENYVYLSGVASNYLSVPDEAALDITGDIDIRVQVALDDWTPNDYSYLIAKYGASGSRSWRVFFNPGGTITLDWSTTGSDSVAATFADPAIPNGETRWIRFTLDVDNGASGWTARAYTSVDGTTWDQFGSDQTGAGVTSIYDSTVVVSVPGGENGSSTVAGSFHRAQVLNGINGTPVLDVDTSVLTSGAATSFPALTGQTVTINRSTSGRKSVAVVSPCWLFGTDDYMEVPDNDLIDFGATDSFTVLAVVRQWATASGGRLLAKHSGATSTPGYWLLNNSVAIAQWLDGTNTEAIVGSFTSGANEVVSVVRDVAADTFYGRLNNTLIDTEPDGTTGTFANAAAFRVGAQANGAYADFELIAVAVFRRALTTTEITTLNTYYQGRVA